MLGNARLLIEIKYNIEPRYKLLSLRFLLGKIIAFIWIDKGIKLYCFSTFG